MESILAVMGDGDGSLRQLALDILLLSLAPFVGVDRGRTILALARERMTCGKTSVAVDLTVIGVLELELASALPFSTLGSTLASALSTLRGGGWGCILALGFAGLCLGGGGGA